MSPVRSILLRLGRFIVGSRPHPIDPEAMDMRDWADLPVYHPRPDAGCAVLRP